MPDSQGFLRSLWVQLSREGGKRGRCRPLWIPRLPGATTTASPTITSYSTTFSTSTSTSTSSPPPVLPPPSPEPQPLHRVRMQFRAPRQSSCTSFDTWFRILLVIHDDAYTSGRSLRGEMKVFASESNSRDWRALTGLHTVGKDVRNAGNGTLLSQLTFAVDARVQKNAPFTVESCTRTSKLAMVERRLGALFVRPETDPPDRRRPPRL